MSNQISKNWLALTLLVIAIIGFSSFKYLKIEGEAFWWFIAGLGGGMIRL